METPSEENILTPMTEEDQERCKKIDEAQKKDFINRLKEARIDNPHGKKPFDVEVIKKDYIDITLPFEPIYGYELSKKTIQNLEYTYLMRYEEFKTTEEFVEEQMRLMKFSCN